MKIYIKLNKEDQKSLNELLIYLLGSMFTVFFTGLAVPSFGFLFNDSDDHLYFLWMICISIIGLVYISISIYYIHITKYTFLNVSVLFTITTINYTIAGQSFLNPEMRVELLTISFYIILSVFVFGAAYDFLFPSWKVSLNINSLRKNLKKSNAKKYFYVIGCCFIFFFILLAEKPIIFLNDGGQIRNYKYISILFYFMTVTIFFSFVSGTFLGFYLKILKEEVSQGIVSHTRLHEVMVKAKEIGFPGSKFPFSKRDIRFYYLFSRKKDLIFNGD